MTPREAELKIQVCDLQRRVDMLTGLTKPALSDTQLADYAKAIHEEAEAIDRRLAAARRSQITKDVDYLAGRRVGLKWALQLVERIVDSEEGDE